MKHPGPDGLERALDDALAQYANVEPLAGFEERLLNRVRAEHAAPAVGFPRWLLALPVAALGGLLAVFVPWKQPEPPVMASIHTAAVQPVWTIPVQAAKARAPRPRILPRSPMRAVFPTPTPVTAEERAWLVLAAQTPEQTREAVRVFGEQSNKPIEIAEIRIEPLRSNHADDDSK